MIGLLFRLLFRFSPCAREEAEHYRAIEAGALRVVFDAAAAFTATSYEAAAWLQDD